MAVTGSWNKNPPNYTAGEQIVGTISGTITVTTPPSEVIETQGPYDVQARVGDVVTVYSYPEYQVTRTVPGTTTEEEALIDAPAGAQLVLGGKVFTVSADRKSITAVA